MHSTPRLAAAPRRLHPRRSFRLLRSFVVIVVVVVVVIIVFFFCLFFSALSPQHREAKRGCERAERGAERGAVGVALDVPDHPHDDAVAKREERRGHRRQPAHEAVEQRRADRVRRRVAQVRAPSAEGRSALRVARRRRGGVVTGGRKRGSSERRRDAQNARARERLGGRRNATKLRASGRGSACAQRDATRRDAMHLQTSLKC